MSEENSDKKQRKVASASREAPSKIMETRQAPSKPKELRKSASSDSSGTEEN